MIVQRHGDRLILQTSGFDTVPRMSIRGRTIHLVERLSYLFVTSKLRCYRHVWRVAKPLAREISGGRNFNVTVFRSACALAVLADHWKTFGLSPRIFALIGDGSGFLGALIRRWKPNSLLYCIDLPKTLIFQAHLHEMVDRKATMSLCATGKIGNRGRTTNITFVLPQDIEHIPDQIDCAINIMGMQEMPEFSVASYFAFLRRRSMPHSRFYCVNESRRKMPGNDGVNFADYPWQENDEIFVDGSCPYFTHFFARSTLPDGPRILGMRVPFVNYFDSVLKHRLVHLAPAQ